MGPLKMTSFFSRPYFMELRDLKRGILHTTNNDAFKVVFYNEIM